MKIKYMTILKPSFKYHHAFWIQIPPCPEIFFFFEFNTSCSLVSCICHPYTAHIYQTILIFCVSLMALSFCCVATNHPFICFSGKHCLHLWEEVAFLQESSRLLTFSCSDKWTKIKNKKKHRNETFAFERRTISHWLCEVDMRSPQGSMILFILKKILSSKNKKQNNWLIIFPIVNQETWPAE